MTESVQQKTQEVISDVKEAPVVANVLPTKGSASVGLASPVAVPAAFVRFYPIGDGRPAVVQWTSYEPDAGPNSFPALLVRATSSATSVDQLVGQTLPGEVYFQAASNAPVLCLPIGTFIDLAITKPEPTAPLLAVKVGAGQLLDPAGGTHALSGITIEGVLP